jgi:2-dehydro-3-deoxyphosphogluconate aldolase/(4S)-4-hydroxy-2-oxoglutarate aldolase
MTTPTDPGALTRHRIIPVIVIDDAARAVDLAHALAAGGIRCAEVTLRTPAALEALAAMAGVPGFTAGAGTVRSLAELAAATDHGAQFVVSPGFDPEVVAAATARGIAALPGIATATELQHALGAGVRTVKFFPADRLGGLAGIAALAAPFPEMAFVPSGGVTAESAAEYLAHPAVPAVSGSWMAPRALLAAGDFAEVELRTRAAVTALGSP